MGLLDQIFAGVGGAASGAAEGMNVTAELQRRREALAAQREADLNERLYRQDQLARQEARDAVLEQDAAERRSQGMIALNARNDENARDNLARDRRYEALERIAYGRLGLGEGQLEVARGRLANDGARVGQGARRVAAVEKRTNQGERRVTLAEQAAKDRKAKADAKPSAAPAEPTEAQRIDAIVLRRTAADPANAARIRAWGEAQKKGSK
jgi:hypothetical protein